MSVMTEEEARTRWCPFARYWVMDGGAGNRWRQSLPDNEPHALNPVPCRCIGSQCMAWRSAEYTDSDGKVRSLGKGYCGLASKPAGAP